MCKWRATHCWKSLDKSYKFALDLVLIGGLNEKLWPHKVAGVPTLVVLGLPIGSLETKSHLDVASVKRCKIYYMGEGVGFPRVRAVVSLVSPKSPMVCLSTKGALIYNQPTCWLVGCKFEWITNCLSFFLVPSQRSSTPLYPFQMLWAKERASTPCLSTVFSLGLTFGSLKELEARQAESVFVSIIVALMKSNLDGWMRPTSWSSLHFSSTSSHSCLLNLCFLR